MSSFFGLDIGTSQVKALQAVKAETGFSVKHFAVENIQGRQVAEVVKSVVKEAGIKFTAEVNVALPESEVYTRIVTTPRLSETELASSIQYEAEQYVPVPMDQVDLFHQVLESSEETVDQTNMRVLLIAVTKERLKQLTTLLDTVGLMPSSLETELFSLKRVFTDVTKAQLIVAFGHKTTDMMVLNKGNPLFLHSMASGSQSLTKTLVNELGLSVEQAEQYKQTYGVREDLLEGKVAALLLPLVDQVVTQIEKAVVYLNQQGFRKKIEQLVMVGGGSLLPGLSSYLVKKTNIEVVVGDPFQRFLKDEQLTAKITSKSNPQLATVVGLAIKGLA